MSSLDELSEEKKEVLFIIRCITFSLIFLISYAFYFYFLPDHKFTYEFSAILAALIIILPVLKEAVKSLLEGNFGMTELVLVAMLASCALGKYLEAAIVGVIICLHEVIEQWTPSGSAISLQEALKLNEKIVERKTADTFEKIKASDLKKDDIIRILPGEVFPVDGIVINGHSTVDKSSITGEGIPEEIFKDCQILAGTSNINGTVTLKIAGGINETVVSHLDKIMTEAKRSKNEAISIIDKFSATYALSVLMICACLFLITKNSDQAISLLIVSFPDALVMAAPLAMIAAITSCARCGVLLKSPNSLLKVSKCHSILLDKTGTLSQGNLNVKEFYAKRSFEDRMTDYSISLAKLSNHPVSKAISSLKCKKTYEVNSFKEEHGLGISGIIEGNEISIGRYKWIQKIDKELSLELPSDLTLSVVAINGKFAGFFKLDDNLKAETPKVISILQKNRLSKIKIISGDLISRVRKIANDLKVDYTGECLPEDKVKEVKKARENSKVMFVGDGLNDAPAMAVADVGVAMKGTGNEVTTGNSDVVLLRNDLRCIPYLKNLSKKTNVIIAQNMICGIVFVILGIFLAATEILTPAYAAVFHLADAIFIVFNSARLIKVDLPETGLGN